MLGILVAFFPGLVLKAQENEKISPQSGIFPLALVLEGAEFAGEGIWRPDWPLDFPPDAFRLPNDAFKIRSGEANKESSPEKTSGISACTVEWDGLSLRYRLGPEGRIEEFPFMLRSFVPDDRMAQVAFVYRRGNPNVIDRMIVAFSSEDTWTLEFLDGFTFLEYKESFPFLIRVSNGYAWRFIYLSRGLNEIIETWYDEEGNALGAYRFSLTGIGEKSKIREVREFSASGGLTEFFYDSRGFLSELFGPEGQYKVLFYREDLPRYWERRPVLEQLNLAEAMTDDSAEDPSPTGEVPVPVPAFAGDGNFSLQWDSNDFLVRIRGIPDLPLPMESSEPQEESSLPQAESLDIEGPYVDYRYEYDLDERGNWIERREVRMIRNFGLLVPSPGITFRRVLEYSE